MRKYALRYNKETCEIHIHETRIDNGKFIAVNKSICGKSFKKQSSFAPINEELSYAIERDNLLFYDIDTPAASFDFDFLDNDSTTVNKFLTEQQVRDVCAKLGRSVCGVCISHFYKTK